MKSSSESLLDAVSQSGAHDAADLLEKASGEDAAKVNKGRISLGVASD